MTYPQQPGGNDPQTPQSPSIPSAPPAQPEVASPYGAPPASGPYGAPAAPGGYGAPGAPGAPTAHGVPDPYAGSYGSPSAAGPQPMSWRTILAYVLCPIAILFIPISGVIAIVFAALGVRNDEKTSRIALGLAIVSTVVGFILSYMAIQ